jgi:hypothetical protein
MNSDYEAWIASLHYKWPNFGRGESLRIGRQLADHNAGE